MYDIVMVGDHTFLNLAVFDLKFPIDTNLRPRQSVSKIIDKGEVHKLRRDFGAEGAQCRLGAKDLGVICEQSQKKFNQQV